VALYVVVGFGLDTHMRLKAQTPSSLNKKAQLSVTNPHDAA